jgi:diketogulonate reductase-like aldo/keto reductase
LLSSPIKLNDRRLAIVARKARRTPAQVLLRWSLQKGFVTIPKSAKHRRIIENAAVFDFSLGAEEMALLDSFNEEHHVTWDPRTEP